MPTGRLPDNPNLEQLKNHAKTLQQFVRARVPEAIALVREFHPRLGGLTADAAELAGFSRADAQLVLARHYGFASWPKLRQYVDVVNRYTRTPHVPPKAAEGVADEFLRLACLNHGDDDPSRWRQAAELLTAHPELTRANIHAAAAAGDVAVARALLTENPGLANQQGGPHHWEPLLYIAYSTVDDRPPGRSHLEVARLLLDAGADPNAGYLWEGLSPPYTALTGALTSSHSQPILLARLLLERGADANDGQALYDLAMAGADDPEPLELLLAFGLGTGGGGPWHARLAPNHGTPAQLVEDELIKAAAGNRPRLARLVLDHGVDVNGHGTNHPIFEGLTAWELAVLNGHTEVVEVLEAAGAHPARPDTVLEFLGACMRADRPTIDRLRAKDAPIVERAIASRPHQISVAANHDRLDAVMLMVELGFDVNAAEPYPHEQTALHGAAYNGNLAMVEFLVQHGADLNVEDCSFHSTPRGWAEHNQRGQVAEYLSRLST